MTHTPCDGQPRGHYQSENFCQQFIVCMNMCKQDNRRKKTENGESKRLWQDTAEQKLYVSPYIVIVADHVGQSNLL